jgi:hypothetical protein
MPAATAFGRNGWVCSETGHPMEGMTKSASVYGMCNRGSGKERRRTGPAMGARVQAAVTRGAFAG